jgi:hypothetical protein
MKLDTLCLCRDQKSRPLMSEVVKMLNGDAWNLVGLDETEDEEPRWWSCNQHGLKFLDQSIDILIF